MAQENTLIAEPKSRHSLKYLGLPALGSLLLATGLIALHDSEQPIEVLDIKPKAAILEFEKKSSSSAYVETDRRLDGYTLKNLSPDMMQRLKKATNNMDDTFTIKTLGKRHAWFISGRYTVFAPETTKVSVRSSANAQTP